MRRWGLAALAVAALVLTGCSSVSTASDQVALHYKGGAGTAEKFANCVDPATHNFDGVGDNHFSYPSNQRNLQFPSKDDNLPTIKFVTKDGIEMSVTGVLNFRLNTSCKKVTDDGKTYPGGALEEFHELIGNRYKAYMDGDETNENWVKMLGVYVFRPLDTAIDRAGQQFTYTQLYNDPAVKAQWEQAVLEQLPALVDRQTDGNTEFFLDYALTLQKPDPPQAIKDALVERQKAIAEADTAKAKADADTAAANAQVATAHAEALKQQEVINGFGSYQNYIWYIMAQQGLNPFQPQIVVGSSGQATK